MDAKLPFRVRSHARRRAALLLPEGCSLEEFARLRQRPALGGVGEGDDRWVKTLGEGALGLTSQCADCGSHCSLQPLIAGTRRTCAS